MFSVRCVPIWLRERERERKRLDTDTRSSQMTRIPGVWSKAWYQVFFWVLIDLIIGFLGLIIKEFDNQTENWAWLSSPLIIKLFEMLDDNHDYFVYKTFTHESKQVRLKPLSKPISQPPPSPPSSYQPSDTVDYLRFLYVLSSSVKTPLSSQVGNFVLIDAFNVFSRVLSMVLFLRASCCFPVEKKTRSIPPQDAGQPWNCLHILTTSGYIWLTWACPGRRPAQ